MRKGLYVEYRPLYYISDLKKLNSATFILHVYGK